jgi:hypothetical protein
VNIVIEKLPLASLAFLGYAIVGAIMLIVGTQDYGSFSHNLLAFGIACGVLGVPRALSKAANGESSFNLLGFIETLPTPSLVFIVFLIASFVSLALNTITFGMFSENVLQVGIACGVVQAAKAAEHVFGAEPEGIEDLSLPPETIASPPPGPPEPPQPPADRPVA